MKEMSWDCLKGRDVVTSQQPLGFVMALNKWDLAQAIVLVE